MLGYGAANHEWVQTAVVKRGSFGVAAVYSCRTSIS